MSRYLLVQVHFFPHPHWLWAASWASLWGYLALLDEAQVAKCCIKARPLFIRGKAGEKHFYFFLFRAGQIPG